MKRMPNEVEIDREPVPGSWLRIIGRFDYQPGQRLRSFERVSSGTCYPVETPTKVREVLETYIGKRDVRLALHFGDTTTGEDWLEEFDVEGYIGRSMGPMHSALLLRNARSDGGGAILTDCIVRIRFANRSVGGDLYRHPSYFADRDKHRSNIPDQAEEAKVWARRFAEANA